MAALSQQMCVSVLKAMAEPTRLRVLALLTYGELNVKDLTRHPGPEPAAHQSPPQTPVRSGAGRACSRRQLGLFPAGRARQKAASLPAGAASAVDADDAVLLPRSRAGGGLAREREAIGPGLLPDPRRRMGQHPCPARGRGQRRGGRSRPRSGRACSTCCRSRYRYGAHAGAASPGAFAAASESTSARPCSPTRAPNSSAPIAPSAECGRRDIYDLPLADARPTPSSCTR